MRARGAHPARTVVLLPYAQLMPLGRRACGAQAPPGRFCAALRDHAELGRSLGGFDAGGHRPHLDTARDVLTARATAGARRPGRAGRVLATPPAVEAARQLAPLAAAVPPTERAAWGARGAQRCGDRPGCRRAAAGGGAWPSWRWSGLPTPSYATDVLFAPRSSRRSTAGGAAGLPARPAGRPRCRRSLGRALACRCRLTANWRRPVSCRLFMHARDAEDEAQRAAACVLAHV